jgi:hypothetical protein
LPVELRKSSPPFGLVISGCEEVDDPLTDAADLGHCLQPTGSDGRQPGECAYSGPREYGFRGDVNIDSGLK